MDYKRLIADLRRKEASDLHLEPGLRPTARLQGDLKAVGSHPLDPAETLAVARSMLSEQDWKAFATRQAVDFSQKIGGVHCRINIMKTHRGVGLAIRLLAATQPTLTRLNLHPTLGDLVKKKHGLIIICGPTGSGKSSTLAALVHEINVRESAHIVTIESPIEYYIQPRRCFIRQREVGRDTPSFERALIDALRQDPDVIMVGEMRDREIIQLTLNAAETGQLVLSTLHSSTTAEAVQRMVAAFPPEIQSTVSAQLADCLIAAISQRLRFNEKYNIRVPVCEIMKATTPVKHLIRQGQFFKLPAAMETGHQDGNWTFHRYEEWLDGRTDFYVPVAEDALEAAPQLEKSVDAEVPVKEVVFDDAPPKEEAVEPAPDAYTPEVAPPEEVFVIEEPAESSLGELLEKMGEKVEPGDEDEVDDDDR
ncbi:MAG: type IV pilus twitching motility protein PilT [Planctomycetota bacterium]